ncbi:MAG: YmdB family metallophosphoesterase, partial [Spirochaetota bacterium]
MAVRILFVGEIVGKAGVYCIKTLLSQLRAERGIDFVIADGDGTTGGFGIGK